MPWDLKTILGHSMPFVLIGMDLANSKIVPIELILGWVPLFFRLEFYFSIS